jgi:hypothetical protein
MTLEIIHPWETSTAAKWKWAVGYLSLRGIDPTSAFYDKPEGDKVLSQIDCLVRTALGTRNWAICMCESSSHMRSLFFYAMASYVFTTGERAYVADVEDLIVAAEEPDSNTRDIVEFADLLMICYCDPDYPQFKWRRGAVANILQRRKFRRLATFVDVFSISIPEPLPKEDRYTIARTVIDSFGANVYDLFTGEDSKHLIVRPEKVKEPIAS